MATVLRPPVVSRQPAATAASATDQWRNAALLGLAITLPVGQSALDLPARAPLAAQQPAPALNLLAGGTLAGKGAKPFLQADWPVPKGFAQPLENRGYVETAPPFILLTGAKPNAQTDWPVPKGSTSFDLRGYLESAPPFILLTGTKPFSQNDWPLAPRRAAPIPQGEFVSAIGVLSSIAPNPFAQRDWPNPRGPLQPSDLRTFFSQGPAPLQGGGAAPVGRSAFDLPTRARSSAPQSDAEQGSPLTILPTGAAPVPFFPPHALNPVARAVAPTVLDELGAPLTLLPFGLPFTPADFQNPPRARLVPQADSFGRALLLASAVPVPFAQTDWPNPRGSAQPTGLIWSNGPPMPFTGGAAPVGRAAIDLPPRAPAPLALGWVVSLQTTTLGVVSLPPGLASVDLPPRGPARGVQDYAQAPIASLYAPVVLPFGQHDWQLPTRARTVPQGQIEAHGASLALAATGGIKPFAQTDWQLPPRGKPPIPFGDFWPAVLTTQSANLVSFTYGNWRVWHLDYLYRAATFEFRPRAWLLSEDYVLTLEKRSSENVKFDFDFSQMLGTGETISSVTSIAATPVSATTPLVISGGTISAAPITYLVAPGGAVDHIAPSGTVVQATIAGGEIAAGAAVQDYLVRCKVVTSVNLVVEGTARLRVNDTPVA